MIKVKLVNQVEQSRKTSKMGKRKNGRQKCRADVVSGSSKTSIRSEPLETLSGDNEGTSSGSESGRRRSRMDVHISRSVQDVVPTDSTTKKLFISPDRVSDPVRHFRGREDGFCSNIQQSTRLQDISQGRQMPRDNPVHPSGATMVDMSVGDAPTTSSDLCSNAVEIRQLLTTVTDIVKDSMTVTREYVKESIGAMKAVIKESTEESLEAMQRAIRRNTLETMDTVQGVMRENTKQTMEAMKDMLKENTEAIKKIMRENMRHTDSLVQEIRDSNAHKMPPQRPDPVPQTESVEPRTTRQRSFFTRNLDQNQTNYTNNNTDLEAEDSETDTYLNAPSLTRTGNPRHGSVKLPPFNGQESWKIWFGRFNVTANLCGWNEERRLRELLQRLQGTAGEFVFGQLNRRATYDYKLLVEELETRFRVVETKKTFEAQFNKRNQKPGESVEEYAAELKRLYDKAHTDRSANTRKEDLLRRFLNGLQDDRARFEIEYHKEPDNIDEAVSHVVNYTEAKRKLIAPEHNYDRRNARAVKCVESITEPDSSDEEHTVLRSKPKGTKKKKKSIRKTTTQNQTMQRDKAGKPHPNKQPQGNDVEIKSLKEQLHKLSEAVEKINKDKVEKPTEEKTVQRIPSFKNKANVQCFRCRQYGHYQNECPTHPKLYVPSSGPSFRPNGNFHSPNTQQAQGFTHSNTQSTMHPLSQNTNRPTNDPYNSSRNTDAFQSSYLPQETQNVKGDNCQIDTPLN